MDDNLRRCMRCDGRKKMYKTGTAYNHTNTGGVLVDCPLCLGKGTIPKLLEQVETFKQEITEKLENEGFEVHVVTSEVNTKKEPKGYSKDAKKERRTRKV